MCPIGDKARQKLGSSRLSEWVSERVRDGGSEGGSEWVSLFMPQVDHFQAHASDNINAIVWQASHMQAISKWHCFGPICSDSIKS